MQEVIKHENDSLFVKAREFYSLMSLRKSVRHFSKKRVSTDIIMECIKVAGTAPSGANRQPWFFSVVIDSEIKSKIRKAAELEEYKFYNSKAPKEFLEDLKIFETTWEKPHLEEASALIVIFTKSYDLNREKRLKSYYSKESVGIATGMLITALHRLGVSTLTHTPNPMRFLNKILERPQNERPFLILAVGYESECHVSPIKKKKRLDEICRIY